MTTSKRKVIGLLSAAALTLSTALTPTAMAAAVLIPHAQKEITLNGTVLSRPYGFVLHGTTYMPIWYVMQLANKLQLSNHWDGVTRVWNVMDTGYAGTTAALATPLPGHMAIDVNEKPVFQDLPRVVRRDPETGAFTTYIPIYFIMQLFNRLAIDNTWDGSQWSVRATGATTTTAAASSSATSTNGSVAGSAPTSGAGATGTGTTSGQASSSSPTTGAGTAGTPSSTGDGVTPSTGGSSITAQTGTTVSTPSLTGLPLIGANPSSGLPSLEGQTVPTVALQNQATSDAAYWQRASESFFVSAQNTSPSSPSSGADTRFVDVKPGQMLYLFAYNNSRNIFPDQTTWQVNSPDALITTDTTDSWSGGVNNREQTLAYFTPTKPGIYTVQAENNGQYSVPLVITVGLSSLAEQPFSLPATYTGILPLPGNLPTVAPQTDGDVSYLQYAAQSNWIPVAGTVTGPFANKVKAITVVLNGATNAQEWDYRLPVDSAGHFAAMIESPFIGNVSVSLVKNYLTLMSNATNNFTYPIDYQVVTTGVPPSEPLQALLPSSAMDYNISPQFTQLADTLLENSTSLETAIAAMNNYVAGDISYNNAELAPNAKYIFTDALTTWNEQLGVCENMAQLGASFLRSVGIPTETVGGYANSAWTTPDYKDQNPDDAHEWLRVWNGTQWQLFDPTWTPIEDSAGVGYGITSEFSTDTTSLLATHAPVADQIATSMSKR